MTPTVPHPADIAAILALSDERDTWMRRIHQAWRDGYNAGRADACVALAEIEHRCEARQWWNEWRAKVWRIISSNDHPDARRRQLEAEIAADQKFMTEAAHLLFTAPSKLSPTQYAVAHRVRFERLDESEVIV